MMRRLYVQIYLAFVAVGLGSLIVTAGVGWMLADQAELNATDAAALAAYAASKPAEQLQASLDDAAAEYGLAVTVWGADGTVQALSGVRLPQGPPGWFRRHGRVGVRVKLPDGRVVGSAPAEHPSRRWIAIAMLFAMASAVALGCYPIARRITRRLEMVEAGVQEWGQGDLAARVPVVGRDEVARVARSFNDAASRVERLFEAQRRVLASASHELRSPLARLRMAVELLAEDRPSDPWVDNAVRDIEELDATVGDLLQVGRMQALDGPQDAQPVDVRALVQDEASHVGASVTGPGWTLQGDPILLRRLVRNLLENASKHGAPPLEAHVEPGAFAIADRGPGVDESDRERIFEPFYRPDGHAEGRDGGVGLGLHLVREIARHHGGEVTVEGRPGGGANFVFAVR